MAFFGWNYGWKDLMIVMSVRGYGCRACDAKNNRERVL